MYCRKIRHSCTQIVSNVMLDDFVTCGRYYNQSRVSISQLWNTVGR